GAFCSSGFGFDGALVGTVLGTGFVAGTLFLAMVLAGALCRKNYHPGMFCLWLYVWVSACVMVLVMGSMGLAAIPMFIATGEPGMALMMLVGSLIYGLVAAVVLSGLVTPFLLLTLMNSLYCARFFAIFRLKGMETVEGMPEELQMEATTPSTGGGSSTS
ncbi:MAG: hypothetical protein GY851_20640, partial [bacterium]|nr:hypothetical protein [bacterium]